MNPTGYFQAQTQVPSNSYHLRFFGSDFTMYDVFTNPTKFVKSPRNSEINTITACNLVPGHFMGKLLKIGSFFREFVKRII